MRKLVLFLALSLLAIRSQAAMVTPKDDRGFTLPTLDFVGANPCNLSASTGTTLLTCGTANTRNVVYGVIASSLAFTDYLSFFDSTTTTLGTGIMSTATVVYNWNGSSTTAATTAASNFYKFPVPIIFNSGVVIRASASPSTGNGVSRWTILYRPLRATE